MLNNTQSLGTTYYDPSLVGGAPGKVKNGKGQVSGEELSGASATGVDSTSLYPASAKSNPTTTVADPVAYGTMDQALKTAEKPTAAKAGTLAGTDGKSTTKPLAGSTTPDDADNVANANASAVNNVTINTPATFDQDRFFSALDKWYGNTFPDATGTTSTTGNGTTGVKPSTTADTNSNANAVVGSKPAVGEKVKLGAPIAESKPTDATQAQANAEANATVNVNLPTTIDQDKFFTQLDDWMKKNPLQAQGTNPNSASADAKATANTEATVKMPSEQGFDQTKFKNGLDKWLKGFNMPKGDDKPKDPAAASATANATVNVNGSQQQFPYDEFFTKLSDWWNGQQKGADGKPAANATATADAKASAGQNDPWAALQGYFDKFAGKSKFDHKGFMKAFRGFFKDNYQGQNTDWKAFKKAFGDFRKQWFPQAGASANAVANASANAGGIPTSVPIKPASKPTSGASASATANAFAGGGMPGLVLPPKPQPKAMPKLMPATAPVSPPITASAKAEAKAEAKPETKPMPVSKPEVKPVTAPAAPPKPEPVATSSTGSFAYASSSSTAGGGKVTTNSDAMSGNGGVAMSEASGRSGAETARSSANAAS